MQPPRQWLEETHGDWFELVRHFLARFFDNELGTIRGEWQKVAIGVFASLVSIGIVGFQLYLHALPIACRMRCTPPRKSTRRPCAAT